MTLSTQRRPFSSLEIRSKRSQNQNGSLPSSRGQCKSSSRMSQGITKIRLSSPGTFANEGQSNPNTDEARARQKSCQVLHSRKISSMRQRWLDISMQNSKIHKSLISQSSNYEHFFKVADEHRQKKYSQSRNRRRQCRPVSDLSDLHLDNLDEMQTKQNKPKKALPNVKVNLRQSNNIFV